MLAGIDETLKEFQAREGVTINTSYNGCGILVAQMQSMWAGGSSDRFPDAYFSCDVSFMSKVQHWFDPSKTISENDMVLIVKKRNPREIASLEDLARPELKAGLGTPSPALGALTDGLLKRAGLHDRVYAEGWQDHIVHTDAGHDLVNKFSPPGRSMSQSFTAATPNRRRRIWRNTSTLSRSRPATPSRGSRLRSPPRASTSI